MCPFRALLVEDNVPFRESVRDMLHANFPSMDIAEASNGAEALRQIELGLPDLIFMDIRLPGESGLDVTKKIKSRHSAAVVLILTSYDLPEYRQAAREYGANYFLTKNTATGDIVALVESIMTGEPPQG